MASTPNLLDWLRVGRVEHANFTVIGSLLGYISATGTIFTQEALKLSVLILFAHWSMFARNNVLDYEYDMKAGKDDRVLVDGRIDVKTADYVTRVGICVFIITSYFIFSSYTFLLFLLCFIAGYIYNAVSKYSRLSTILLVLWAVYLIFMGASYGGVITHTSKLLAVFTGLCMGWFHIIGELLDADEDEINLARDLIEYNPVAFIFAMTLSMSTIVVLARVITDIPSIYGLGVPIVGGSLWMLLDYNTYRDKIKENMIKIMPFFLIMLGVIVYSISSIEVALIIAIGSPSWGFTLRKMLYGSIFYFP